MQGICKEFDINKGYGTIIGDDGKSYFCHFSAIQSERIQLDEGENVTFEPTEGQRGLQATLVKHG